MAGMCVFVGESLIGLAPVLVTVLLNLLEVGRNGTAFQVN